ncbi:MAG: outer membrane protein precursor [Verrucomicrobiota bacterium]|jgi:peptidoglycan-associated lipoprotein
MISRTLTHSLLLVALVFSSTACKTFRKKEKDPLYANDGDFVKPSSLGGAGGPGGSGLGTPLPERTEGSSFLSAGVDRHRFAPVHFGFDSFTVSASEQPKVAAVASALKGSRDSVILAGFTDERGTPEYNRGLGERRAQAVRQVLIGNGLAADRIQTVSFGAEMPVDTASNEAAWAKNRRAEFGITK